MHLAELSSGSGETSCRWFRSAVQLRGSWGPRPSGGDKDLEAPPSVALGVRPCRASHPSSPH